ncbi:MAG: hypothetical protein IPF68_00595 [Bacteroidales bacterium]|nr:hypothetical protein [Bacteroidales bacterium]
MTLTPTNALDSQVFQATSDSAQKDKDFKTTKFHTLRYATQAGGKLHTAFIEEFIDAFPDIRFNVMYGQTEATARLSYLPPEDLRRKLGSLGRGIPRLP